MFPLSSARTFSGEEIDLPRVSIARLATRGGADRSQLETVARVTPSKRASSDWFNPSRRLAALNSFAVMVSVLRVKDRNDVRTGAKIALPAFDRIWSAIDRACDRGTNTGIFQALSQADRIS